jgi:predicted nucleic acid-binding protein
LLAASQKGSVRLYASAINIGEVYYSLLSAPALARDWRDRAPTLPVKIEVPTMEDIWQASEIKGRFTISYADAFAAALAQKVRGTLVTGDPDFRQILGLKLDWVGTP